MKRLKISRLLLTNFLLLLLVSSGFSYKKVKVFVLIPPGQILPGVQRIAVLDFEGRRGGNNLGKNFSDYLINKLILPDRGIHAINSGFLGMGKKKEGRTFQEGTFTNVFDVVERSRISQVIEEQQLGMSGLINETQAVSIGKVLGVQAIVMGSVDYTNKDYNSREKRTRTQNKQKVVVTVNCTKRDVHATVRARVIGTESGQILGSTEASTGMSEKKCEADRQNLKTVYEMVNQCLRKLSEEVANYLAPRYSEKSFELEKIKTDPFKKIAEQAAEDAENFRIDPAYLKYKSIYDKDPYNPRILYNLGILQEVVGNVDKAAEFYQMALQLKDEGKYKDAVKRIEKSAAYKSALADMGIEIQEHVFRMSRAELSRSTAMQVQIKGKAEQRVPLYAKPEKGSQIVTRVPGGISFKVKKRKGDWFLLELLGGKEGYIHKSQVDTK